MSPPAPHDFSGQSILITGGTKGLGLATARLLAHAGAKQLVLTYRKDHDGAAQAQQAIEQLGAACTVIACDLAEDGAVEQLFDTVATHTPALNLYIHNAAATAFKDLRELKAHHIDKTLNITVKSFILGVQRAAQLMPHGGAIIAVSGLDTDQVVPRHGLLGAAKAALETLTMYYAHELAAQKIRVNGISPGFFPTDSTRVYFGAAFDAVSQSIAANGPLKRAPALEEIANAILLLCSPAASWIVGQTIVVDGGQNDVLPSFALNGA